MRSVALSEGSGPGEIQNVRKLAVDANKNIYLSDDSRRRIIKLDPDGHYLFEFPVSMRISQLLVDSENNIYVCGFLFSYQGPLVRKYDQQGNLLTSFCRRYDFARHYDFTGGSARMTVGYDNRIFYAFDYPYEIRAFNSDGILVNRFSRKNPMYKAPVQNKTTRSTQVFGAQRGLFEMQNGNLLNIFLTRKDETSFFYMDMFDNEGTFLMTVDLATFDIDFVRNVCMDNQHQLYLDFLEPFPHIVKYKLEVK